MFKAAIIAAVPAIRDLKHNNFRRTSGLFFSAQMFFNGFEHPSNFLGVFAPFYESLDEFKNRFEFFGGVLSGRGGYGRTGDRLREGGGVARRVPERIGDAYWGRLIFAEKNRKEERLEGTFGQGRPEEKPADLLRESIEFVDFGIEVVIVEHLRRGSFLRDVDVPKQVGDRVRFQSSYRGVEVILDRVLGPTGNDLAHSGPGGVESGQTFKNESLLLVRPISFLDARIENVDPSLAALLPASIPNFLGALRPASRPIFSDPGEKNLVFLRQPVSFLRAPLRIFELLHALLRRFIGQLRCDFSPVFALSSDQRDERGVLAFRPFVRLALLLQSTGGSKKR